MLTLLPLVRKATLNDTKTAGRNAVTALNTGRWMAPRDRDFVLFRIGMRFNGLRGLGTALRTFAAMPPCCASSARSQRSACCTPRSV